MSIEKIVFSDKNENSFSNIVKNFISILTFDVSGPVGSFSLKSRPLWSDIDILEFLTSDADTNERALKEFELFFKKVVKKIEKDKNVIFSDFKAGIDDRFVFNKNTTKSKIIELIPSLLTTKIKSLPDDEFLEEIKQLKTLRWTEKEILKGEKTNVGKKFKLWKALGDDSLVKIDIFGLYPGRFIEVSNFMVLGRFIKNEKRVDPFFKIIDLREAVSNDIIKFTKSGDFFKVLKRLFVIKRLDNNVSEGTRIVKFLNSPVGILGSVMSDMSDLITLLKAATNTKTNKKKLIKLKDALFDQIDILKDKIANTPLSNRKSNRINKLLDFLVLERKNIYSEDMIEILEQIIKIIKPVLDKFAENFILSDLQKINIDPKTTVFPVGS
ncbi:hypothetical protein LCGC14_0704690 [marine sediment metagenome]|uniref:Uncharacterized protein n=1 Tax=marine sediment metagenome TaxID=412755 RepID=A0A0F9R2A1_9ZZZZ|nr:hypothetical protein [archaeon]